MHPEISLVLLTVLAGAGQGVFITLAILYTLFQSTGNLPSEYIIVSGALSVILQLIGIAASTMHLGNPSRGWKAALMFRNSWLSREVITLSLSVGFTCAFLALYYYGASYNLLLTAAALGIIANAAFYISSSMVYASVKFIREWANIYTPLNFTLLGITSGMALNLAVLNITGVESGIAADVTWLLMTAGIISLFVKSLSFRFNSQVYVSVNIKNALGTNDPEIHQMDMGTPYDHYNTKEYYYPVDSNRERLEITGILILTFLIPLSLWTIMSFNSGAGASSIISAIAALSMLVGVLLERRLFFIQGRNLQNLYYNNFKKGAGKNPLLSRARRGTPAPVK